MNYFSPFDHKFNLISKKERWKNTSTLIYNPNLDQKESGKTNTKNNKIN